MSVSGLNTAEAAIGVSAVLVANIVLRPVVQRINRQSVEGTEVVSSYEIRAVCRQDVEERIRTTMISAVRSASMSLIAVYSEDIGQRTAWKSLPT